MHVNSQSWETTHCCFDTNKLLQQPARKKTKPTQQTLFVTAGPFFDISQNRHKLEITSK